MTEIVGRTAELHAIPGFLDQSMPVMGLVLRGEPGIGKTVLWQHVVSRARAAGYTVLTAQPTTSETRLSYAALADLVSAFPVGAVDALPEPQKAALDVALLRTVGARTEQLAVSMAFVSLLSWSSSSAPVLVAVDDAQWIDAPTCRVLEFAFRRTADRAVRFLLAARSGESAALTDALVRAFPGSGTSALELEQLSLGALHQLISSRLGQHFPRPTLVKLQQVSQGNPLLALEIARALLESGESLAPGALLPVPRSLHQLLSRRIVRLPRATRDALLVMAGSADPTTDTIERVFGVADARALLDPAETSGVVVAERGRLRFGHPLMASVVYGTASPARLRELHGKLAAVASSDEERARHLALSTDTANEAIASELERAGAEAGQRGAPDAAAELMALARALTPVGDTASRTRRLLAAAEAMLEAGATSEGRRLLEEAASDMPRSADRARVLLLLATIRWYDDAAAAFAVGEDALVDAANDPTLMGQIHTRLALFSPDQEQAAAHSDAAVRLIDPDEDPSLLAFALFGSFYDQVQSGKAIHLDMFQRALAIEPERATWEVSTIPALWWKYTDDYALARGRLHQHLGWARESGDASSDADLLAHLAELELWAGDWRLAEQYASASVDAAEQMGQPLANPSHRASTLVQAHLGQTTAARAAAAQAQAECSDDATLSGMYHLVLGFAALSDEDANAADQYFSALEHELAGLGMNEPIRFRWEHDHIDALVVLGQLERAELLVKRLETRHAFLPRPWTGVVVPRSRALVAAAKGDLKGAIHEASLAIAAGASLASPFEVARTLLVQGQILRRANQRRAAAVALHRAQLIFDDLGAIPWAARAESEATRLGRRRDAGSALTPGEREVALLAAQGLTNRVVAERLFVSPKTVEANLSRVYSKLSIRSRAELGRVMSSARPDD